MSTTELAKFLEFLNQDKQAATSVKSMGTDFKAIAGFATKAGFPLTEVNFAKGTELSMEDLDGIAGGKKTFFANNDQVGGFLDF